MHPEYLPEKPEILTVSQLNQAVSRLLERNFPLAWVSGEISNFTRAASGHWYFTLKDQGAQVRAVMFKGRAKYADFNPREGDKVEVRALVSLYQPRGDFQLNVESIRRAGVGNLYEAFLKLKKKLADEGLGTTLLPYLHTLDLNEKNKLKLRPFKDPKPAREVSLIYPKNELKIHIINALRDVISGVVRGAIAFSDVEIISPKNKK